jgi:hypothetical protein
LLLSSLNKNNLVFLINKKYYLNKKLIGAYNPSVLLGQHMMRHPGAKHWLPGQRPNHLSGFSIPKQSVWHSDLRFSTDNLFFFLSLLFNFRI